MTLPAISSRSKTLRFRTNSKIDVLQLLRKSRYVQITACQTDHVSGAIPSAGTNSPELSITFTAQTSDRYLSCELFTA